VETENVDLRERSKEYKRGYQTLGSVGVKRNTKRMVNRLGVNSNILHQSRATVIDNNYIFQNN
jgi:hypothetical protein